MSGRQIVPGSTERWHRVIACVDDAHPQRRRGAFGGPGDLGGALHVSEDLPGLDQERRSRRGQSDIVCGALQQTHAQLPLQPLDLLSQRRPHDVLAGRRPAEVELLGNGDE